MAEFHIFDQVRRRREKNKYVLLVLRAKRAAGAKKIDFYSTFEIYSTLPLPHGCLELPYATNVDSSVCALST